MQLLSAALDAFWGCFSCGRTLEVGSYRVRVRRQLAEGGFSYVYEAVDASSQKRYALKKMIAQSSQQSKAMKWEISVHRAFKHANILPVLATKNCVMPNGNEEFWLLLPMFERGSLQDYVLGNAHKGLEEGEVLRLFLGICRAVKQMHDHEPPWAHRDIKPGNVLLSAKGEPVLMDFGSTAVARVNVESRTAALDLQDLAAQNSSMQYRAPELFDVPTNSIVDERTDVWSLGATLFAISFGRGYSPFECELKSLNDGMVDNSSASSGYRPTDCTYLRVIGRVQFPARTGGGYSDELANLVTWMLEAKAEKRPTINKVIARVRKIAKSRVGGAGADDRV